MLKEFIEKANTVHNNFYDYSIVDYKNNKVKIKIICPIHGTFEQKPINHTQGQGCPKCAYDKVINASSCRKTKDKLLEDFKNVHGNKYDYSLIGDYKNNQQKLEIICLKHGVFNQSSHSHLNGNGCPKCAIKYKSEKLTKTNDEFIYLSNKVHNNFYTYDKLNYINNKTKVIINCPKHGYFKVIPSHHMNGVGCPKCAGNYRRTNEEFINECKIKHGNKYDYSLVEFKNMKSKIKIICKKHGIFYQDSGHHINGHGCPVCNSSIGENKIREILKRLDIDFEEQIKFDDCKNIYKLVFDFYLTKFNICIEYNGRQHYESIEYFGGEQGLLVRKQNDNIKKEYCKKNKIVLKSISYKKFNSLEEIIKNITNK